MANIRLKGSERVDMPGARVLAASDPTERLEVTVLVRRRGREQLRGTVAELAAGKSAGPCLSRAEFAQRYGADASDLAAVRAFAAAHGISVVLEHAARRTVILSGTVAQFSTAFKVQLQQMQHDSCSYRGRSRKHRTAEFARWHRRGCPGSRQSAAGGAAFQGTSGDERVRIFHAAADRFAIRISGRHRPRGVRCHRGIGRRL